MLIENTDDAGPASGYFPQLFRLQLHQVHRTLRVSPAMAADVTDRIWGVEDLVALWEACEQRRAERVA